MGEKWSPEELKKYKRVIEDAPKSRAKADSRRKDKLNKLFNRLHGRELAPKGR